MIPHRHSQTLWYSWLSRTTLTFPTDAVTLRAMITPDSQTEMEVMIVADEWPQMHTLGTALASDSNLILHASEAEGIPADLSPYDAVIMYVHGVMGSELEQALIRYAVQGGRLIILHHGLASSKINNPAWMEFTGMHIEPPSAKANAWKVLAPVTHSLVNLNPKHYITSHDVTYNTDIWYQSSDALTQPGVYLALSLSDTELFLNQQFTDGRQKTILFGAHCLHPETGAAVMQDRGGWVKPVGNGWICYLQPGHSEQDFMVPDFHQIILNCITWTP